MVASLDTQLNGKAFGRASHSRQPLCRTEKQDKTEELCVFNKYVCALKYAGSGKMKPKLVRVRRVERVNVTLSSSVILFNEGKVIVYDVYD